MSKKKKTDTPKAPLVTFVETPLFFQPHEISEIQQNDTDELALDQDLDLDLSEEEDAESESLNDQMDKLARAVSEQTEADLQEAESHLESILPHDTEAELSLQIAEDQALQQELHEGLQTIEAEEAKSVQETSPPSANQVLDLEELQSCIETLLFLSDKPLSVARLQELLGAQTAMERFAEAVEGLTQRYQAVHHGIEISEVGGGLQFRTKVGRASLAQKLVKVQTQRLSTGAMETLAIMAYKQPLMKEEVDKIRGVDSSYFVRGLLERKLIKITGRSELPGRPMLYETTPEFLEVFGLKDLSSLPSLRELEQMVPYSETHNPEDEDPKIREMRRLVGEMKADKSSALHYDPREDEKILKEIRTQVNAIPTSTPYLEGLKAAELLAKQQAEAPELEEPLLDHKPE